MGDNLDLALASLADLDEVAEVSGAALDLDAVVEELLKGGGVEDLVVDGLRAVDDVLLQNIMLVHHPGRFSTCADRENSFSRQRACVEWAGSTFLVIFPALGRPLMVALPAAVCYIVRKESISHAYCS